uniref:Lipase domain-containing protein n=1 Tax=Pavo cristatus TaxID=9049 RepID=A0A8C9FWS2_PAVCR
MLSLWWSIIREGYEEENCPEFTDLNIGYALSGTELQVQLLLYTRENQNCSERLIEHNVTASKYLNTSKKTVFVIHGYRPTGSQPAWLDEMKKLLLSSGDINLIIVDWNRGATTVIYTTAVDNCRKVAEILKNYVDQMLVSQLEFLGLLETEKAPVGRYNESYSSNMQQ